MLRITKIRLQNSTKDRESSPQLKILAILPVSYHRHYIPVILCLQAFCLFFVDIYNILYVFFCITHSGGLKHPV